jgi:cephalosporin-C deacetylase-like acetyl esterase
VIQRLLEMAMPVPTRTLQAAFFALAFFCSGWLLAADPKSETQRGEKLLDAYLRRETQRLADSCLSDIKSKEDWLQKRPELHRQFLEMLGLWPLPPRTDLKPVITGKINTERFIVEKLHFQSMPGLYVTANLYVPKLTNYPAPAVVYVCGHGPTVVDGVPYGNKVTYHHHAIWFAEHGYVCIVLDSLELGEIPGVHHGTYRLHQWWWQTVGYTPAGVECWNAMRAIDYLQSRIEVDRQRIGVTGRSGGGATSWWVGAADERVGCIIPVAGIADLQAHVVAGVAPRYRQGVVSGHCDCMYFNNTYRWDFPMVAALCAPRPLLLGNSDADDIFPVPGYRRLADKVQRLYALLGASEKFALLETKGPHKDTPELRLGAYRWMNRWLTGNNAEVTEPDRPRLTPAQLKVLDRRPDDALNGMIQETFVKPAHPQLPESPAVARSWWEGQRQEWLRALPDKVFRGWPSSPPPLNLRASADVRKKGVRLRAFDFTSEENIDLRLWLLTADKVAKPSVVILTALDEPGWQEWLTELGPGFKDALQISQEPALKESLFTQNRQAMEAYRWAFAFVAPRGIGPTRWAEPESFEDIQIRRRFALLGQALDGQRVWDIRRAAEALHGFSEMKSVPVWLQGKGQMAGIVLYAAIFEPAVARLDLWNPPASHREGPIFLNVRRILDMPQAVALGLSKEIRIYVKDEAEARNWEWPVQLQKALGLDSLKIRIVGD